MLGPPPLVGMAPLPLVPSPMMVLVSTLLAPLHSPALPGHTVHLTESDACTQRLHALSAAKIARINGTTQATAPNAAG